MFFFTRTAQCMDLSKEELRKLKEGEIIIGEDGKKYRVKKSILPKESVAGPHNIGEVEDRSLRKVEANVLIPNLMNKRIEQVECKPQLELLVGCMRREGSALGLSRCKDTLAVFNECKQKMFDDSQFRQTITDEYLRDRSEARRTGMTIKERKMEEYRQWKRENQKAES